MGQAFHLNGDPEEIGRAYGRALRGVFPAQATSFLEKGLAEHGLLDLRLLRVKAGELLDSLPEHFVREMRGFAEGVGLPLERVAEWHAEYMARTSCSTLVTFPEGVAWAGHNADYADFGTHKWGCTVIIEKRGRIPIMHFPLPGDLFAYQGVNREQLWLHVNWLPAPDVPKGTAGSMPYLFFVREALETCRSIPDVENLLASHCRDSGMALTVIDGKTDEAAIFECTCSTHGRLQPECEALLATNHYRCGKTSEESDSHYDDSARRLARTRSLVSEGRPSCMRDFVGILSDPAIEGTGWFSGTIMSLVACPGRKLIWLSQGAYPAASRGKFRKVEWPW